MADAYFPARMDDLTDCLLNDRPIAVPAKGYWGPRSLAALAAAAVAVLRSGDWGSDSESDGSPPDAADGTLVGAVSADVIASVHREAEQLRLVIEENWARSFYGPTACEQNLAELSQYFEPESGVRRMM